MSEEGPEEIKPQVSKSTHISPSVKIFPMSSVRKIVEMEMNEFGSVNRVSSNALIVLYDVILKQGRKVARRAIEYAVKENRKTVSEDDIKRAVADVLL